MVCECLRERNDILWWRADDFKTNCSIGERVRHVIILRHGLQLRCDIFETGLHVHARVNNLEFVHRRFRLWHELHYGCSERAVFADFCRRTPVKLCLARRTNIRQDPNKTFGVCGVEFVHRRRVF